MELHRRDSKVQRIVTIKARRFKNIKALTKLIFKTSHGNFIANYRKAKESTFIIVSTHYINTEIYAQ